MSGAVTWQQVTATTWTGAPVSLELPPGWWVLRLAGGDPVAAVDRLVAEHCPQETVPELRFQLAEEWRRLVRVATAGGAILLGGGVARDEATGWLITATFVLAPTELADTVGPRQVRLVTAYGPIVDVQQLEVEYLHGGTWSLTFSTPSLRHGGYLATVFDAIAGTLRVDGGLAETGADTAVFG
jgi:hypothetical protein